MFPLPLSVPVAPPAATAVQVTLESDAAKVSATVAPVTSLGPAFVTTMV